MGSGGIGEGWAGSGLGRTRTPAFPRGPCLPPVAPTPHRSGREWGGECSLLHAQLPPVWDRMPALSSEGLEQGASCYLGTSWRPSRGQQLDRVGGPLCPENSRIDLTFPQWWRPQPRVGEGLRKWGRGGPCGAQDGQSHKRASHKMAQELPQGTQGTGPTNPVIAAHGENCDRYARKYQKVPSSAGITGDLGRSYLCFVNVL